MKLHSYAFDPNPIAHLKTAETLENNAARSTNMGPSGICAAAPSNLRQVVLNYSIPTIPFVRQCKALSKIIITVITNLQ